ncbi:nucleotidyltransferase family protein [Syntrophomonas wolfei]|uniref:nucleotidyltransferase family protein n=1 Tax=Syntrophomonas wolfei TaxID=863 RepID=UPI000773CC0D|nr:nucleotidyltransferase domain-containing protein [Syntrophomonas wolfei]
MSTGLSEDILIQAVRLLPEEVYPDIYNYLNTLAEQLELQMPTIEDIKTQFRPVLEKYNISKAYLFGSYARGDHTIKSDIDIQILPLESQAYLSFDEEFKLTKELNNISKIKVSVVQDDLKERVQKRVMEERVLIYER